MLTLYHNGEQYPLQNTEYYIRELANGLDEIIFSISIYDDIYAIIAEEEQITDRAGQVYKIKQIDAGAKDAKIVCQLDIDAWRSTLNVNYNSGTKTVNQQITAVLPAGWTLNDRSSINIGRTIEGDMTPYDICVRCTEVYSVYIRWDNKNKVCTIYPKAMGTPVGAFATRELNLKEINYKGKSNDIVTRLYAYGKDGLSFADINSGKAYVDNFTYTNKIICGIWRDERYTVAADLLADAQERLAQLSKPVRTYECSIVDLQATNPALYNNLDFSLFTAATLIDDIKNNAVDYQVIERHIYPYHPERNEVIFNSEPLKITASVVNITDAIENPSSTYNQIQAQRIEAATNWLLSGDGYVVAVKGTNGEWKELLFMDDDDMALAQHVLRINENGIGFSTTGVNGPYTNAWTIDGHLVADFITTGTLTASLIKAGILTDLNGKFSLDMQTGALSMADGTFSGTITGSSISGGSITGSTIKSYRNGSTANGYVEISGGNLLVESDANNYFEVRAMNNHKIYVTMGEEITVNWSSTGRVQRDLEYLGWAVEDAYNAHSSDERLKDNIDDIPVDHSREIITNARPRYFEFKNTLEKGKRSGFIAQELRQTLDEIKDNSALERASIRRQGYREVLYEDFIAHLVNTTKDLYAKLDEVSNELKKVKESVNG